MADINQAIIQADTQLQGRWESLEVQCPLCYSTNFTYIFEDNKTMYCLQCTEEFDANDTNFKSGLADGTIKPTTLVESKEDKKDDNKSLPPAKVYVPSCGRHKPTMVIDGKSWSISGGTKANCVPFMNDFDIVLNLSGFTAQYKHSIPIPGLKKYETSDTFIECMIDWPDYSVPDLDRKFWIDLIAHAKKNKLKVLAVCVGGHGRTGTALAAMQTVALGWTAEQAIDWIRKNYCDEAIEAKVQEDYISYVAGESNKMPEPGSKDPFKGVTGFSGTLWDSWKK